MTPDAKNDDDVIVIITTTGGGMRLGLHLGARARAVGNFGRSSTTAVVASLRLTALFLYTMSVLVAVATSSSAAAAPAARAAGAPAPAAGTGVSAFIVPPSTYSATTTSTTTTTSTPKLTPTPACLYLCDSTVSPTCFPDVRPLSSSQSSVASAASAGRKYSSLFWHLPSSKLQQQQQQQQKPYHQQRPNRRRLEISSSLFSTRQTTGTSESKVRDRDDDDDEDDDDGDNDDADTDIFETVQETEVETTTTTNRTQPPGGSGGLHAKKWNQRFEEIKKYQDKNNGSSYPPLGTSLRYWANSQRTSFNKEQMYAYRIELLNSINFQWSKPKGGPKLDWDMMYDRLVVYKDRCGDTKVPTQYPQDPQLGLWCYKQKKNYHKGILSHERKAKLDGIGFVVDKYVSHDDRWDDMYNRLVGYWKKNNSTNVPKDYEDDPQLGRWVNHQRIYYKKNDSAMTDEKIERLEAIGFVWDAQEALWQEMYSRLVQYWKLKNSTIVPQRYEDDPELGWWVTNQRTLYKKNDSRMTPERIEKLEAIAFVWDPFEASWQEMYSRLLEYKQEKGNADVSRYHDEDRKLGNWVNSQRTTYRNGKLSPDRMKKLEQIGFKWRLGASKGEREEIKQ